MIRIVDKKSTNKTKEVINVTDTKMLRELIESKGIKYGFIAEKLGISHQSLIRKMENNTQFKACEIKDLCDLLNISDLKTKELIFFTH